MIRRLLYRLALDLERLLLRVLARHYDEPSIIEAFAAAVRAEAAAEPAWAKSNAGKK